MKKEIALFLVLTLLTPGCMGDSEPDVFYGEDISPPVPVSDFILTDQNGDPISLEIIFSPLFGNLTLNLKYNHLSQLDLHLYPLSNLHVQIPRLACPIL